MTCHCLVPHDNSRTNMVVCRWIARMTANIAMARHIEETWR